MAFVDVQKTMAWLFVLKAPPLRLLIATVLALTAASLASASDVLVGEAAKFDDLVKATEFALVEL